MRGASSKPVLLLLLCLPCLVTSSQSQASLRATNAGDVGTTAVDINTAAQEDASPLQLRRELKGKKKNKKDNKEEAADESEEGDDNEEDEGGGDDSDKETFEEQAEEAKQLEEDKEEEKKEEEVEVDVQPEAEATPTEEDAEAQDTTATEEEADTLSSLPLHSMVTSAMDLTTNLTKNINTTAISLSACEQIEMTLSFLTSLDFDQEFWKVMNFTKAIATDDSSDDAPSTARNLQDGGKFGGAIWEVYLMQLILMPVSVITALFGSNLLHPTVCLAAAGMGIFLVFHLVDFMARSQSPFLISVMAQIDCQMKLALSIISAFVSAMLASTFLRFGLFTLGALAAGGASYLVFDAFPMLDPTRDPVVHSDGNIGLHGQLSSELSPFAWIVTTLIGVFGGIFLRWFELAALELVTAALGGLGCAYSLHTFVILQGWQLNRSLVFLIANFIAFSGWRFQRHRRLYSATGYHKKNDTEVQPLVVQAAPTFYAQPPPQQSAASWNQLQTSINGLLQRSNNNNSNNTASGPSEDQILELTKSLNTLLTKMERKESNVSTSTEKSA